MFLRDAALLAAAFLGLAVAGSPAHSQEAGTWEGIADQPGVGTFPIVIVLDGRGGGTTAYPESECTGMLSSGPGFYRETIVTNRAMPDREGGCLDGDFSVQVSGDSLDFLWTGTWLGDAYNAAGTLKRAGTEGKESVACGACGSALANGLRAGLASQPRLFTYVQQQMTRYEACTARAESGACASSCWREQVASRIPECNRMSDAGLRACIEKAAGAGSDLCR